jgi:integrase
MNYLYLRIYHLDMAEQRSENLARERAPTRGEFETMLRGIEENVDPEYKMECKFILYSIGELGLRAGEVAHMKRDRWVKLDKRYVQVPDHQWCDCGYCQDQARQAVQQRGIDFNEAMKDRWKPVNDAGVRKVYFHYNKDILRLYKRFWDYHDEFPVSRVTVNRRVDRIVENSDIDRDPNSINPQSLRASAAYYHAEKGIGPRALAQMMGWANEETALKYIRATGDGLRSELSRIHS